MPAKKKSIGDLIAPGVQAGPIWHKKKPGRKKGTGTQDKQMNFRTNQLTAAKLQWCQEHSTRLKDKSIAAIIEDLVDEHYLMQRLYFDHLPAIK